VEKKQIIKWRKLYAKKTISVDSTVPTLYKLFQNPINISNQGRNKSNHSVVCHVVKSTNKMKRKRIQDVVEVVSSNTFASVLQVSEDNLKEFLVSILCLCIQTKKSK
jgi:predicted peroxiredoxin